MRLIHKYELPRESGSIVIPAGATLLSVQQQDEKPQMWALVDPAARLVNRVIRCIGTGLDAPEVAAAAPPGEYIGTVQFHWGRLVLHYFDGGEYPL
jgi:hypothetical protein